MTTLEKPKNLQEARKVLRGLGVTETQMPTTLAKSIDKIAELSGSQFVQPAGGSVIERAREYLGPAANRTGPEDMTASQLEAAIGLEKDPRKRKDLFNELNEREAGKPRRSVLEQTRGLADAELEQRIQATKDRVERAELFSILTSRGRK